MTDVSDCSFAAIAGLYRRYFVEGFTPVVMVGQRLLPVHLNEAWLVQTTTEGFLQKHLQNVIAVRSVSDLMKRARTIVEAEATAGQPKQPTEVDRIKIAQKQQNLLQKKRDTEELLGAQQRELEKKSRETMSKIERGGDKQKQA